MSTLLVVAGFALLVYLTHPGDPKARERAPYKFTVVDDDGVVLAEGIAPTREDAERLGELAARPFQTDERTDT